MEGSAGDVAQLLASTKAVDILPAEFTLITIDSNSDVQHALKVLVDNNIYSAPVIDAATHSCLGLVDYADVVTFLVQLFARKATQEAEADPVAAIAHGTFTKEDLPRMQFRFYHHPVKEIINISGQNPYKPMPLDSTLQQVLDVMASGLSRVPLTDAEGKVVKIISQSNIVALLAKNIDKAGAKAQQTLAESRIGTRVLVTAKMEERAIDAFAKISSRKISHLALLDGSGHLAGNISVRDVKAATDFHRLVLPVGEYVNIIRRESLKDIYPAIHANDSDTVGKTIARLATIRIHRIYLTSIPVEELGHTSNYAPTGVVSLRDVLSLFATRT